MHTTVLIPNARRRRRRGTMVALLAGCAGLVGCGGSTPGHRSGSDGAPAAASATAVAPKPAVAPVAAASGPRASSIASQCSASAGGNPATMIVCLARHGVKVQTNARFVSCLQSASDAAAVNACVTRDVK